MDALGICVGASTIQMVRLADGSPPRVVWSRVRSHEGDSRGALLAMLQEIEDLAGLKVAATGRKFRRLLALPNISEPEAVERAAELTLPKGRYRTILSAGGETFLVYRLDTQGKVQEVHTGNKCASGTGEFLLQQLGRMDLRLDDIESMDVEAPAHRVSGRCSVFCKSDCTHALNKGVPRAEVVSGLTRMMAGKGLELMKKLPKDRLVLIGGCSANRFMVHHLRREIGELHIPEQASWFEALGAASWALEHAPAFAGLDNVFVERRASFSFLKPLSQFRDKVEFKSHPRGTAQAGDRVILGLDVGSTTTKGVLMRQSDRAILAAEYLRTLGDPVGASRRVYAALAGQVEVPLDIVGLGVTGSGRAIAGLHAGTLGVINEIIAHATAAVHFDSDVQTIFEIGGQDAKYTYITHGVPSDYAMNEACSAGTGSFLEESAKETLGVEVDRIGGIALTGQQPPNFNDQCAAFISSDIKIAIQEGLPQKDIVAGLVYSICMNYANRVKGNRAVGDLIFMQGGVCYNEAVPVAMAALTGKRIVVPPDPGLMGAFGVALEVSKRLEQGLMEPVTFDLQVLAGREVRYRQPFRCRGGKEGCDRGCEIARIEMDGKVFPFGGICNRYENLVRQRKVDASLDMVRRREERVLAGYTAPGDQEMRPVVGINRSYLIFTYFPLLNAFFQTLGFAVRLSESVDPLGVDQKGSAFCFPGELSHGALAELLSHKLDWLFLPHFRGLPYDRGGPAETDIDTSCACVLVQGEPYYLRSAFPSADGPGTLSPVLDFSKGLEAAWPEFGETASQLGKPMELARKAFQEGLSAQRRFQEDIRAMGRKALARLEAEPDVLGVVLFGRPYNAFSGWANKGVPAKFATRGALILPFDMLPYEEVGLEPGMNMYWAMGRMILKAARYTRDHPRLFGAYITNFSCGPDSFLLSYFRRIMGRKPSVTLELDSHTADAGLETRIEAFLDIARASRELEARRERHSLNSTVSDTFRPARMIPKDGRPGMLTSRGEWISLFDKRARMIIPTMGRYFSELAAEALKSTGIRSMALPSADEEVLKLGRGHASCKECLPLQLTLGSLLDYLKSRNNGEYTAFFMPRTKGPCRFGQYSVYTQSVLEQMEIPDVAVFSPCSSNGYDGMGDAVTLAAWRCMIIGDLFEEMYSTVLAGAKYPEEGSMLLEEEFRSLCRIAPQGWKALWESLPFAAKRLSRIELRAPYEELPKISLIGEIFVRNDLIARQGLIERMAERGIIVRTSPISEWIKYTDWLIKNKLTTKPDLGFWIRLLVKWHNERKIRRRLAASGLFYDHTATIEDLVHAGQRFIDTQLGGEAILTVGAAFHEVFSPACGIISIGPFGCMPSRVAEAILSERFTVGELNLIYPGKKVQGMEKETKLPFLAIETDGNPFPQIIEARLEAFCLQSLRLHERMLG